MILALLFTINSVFAAPAPRCDGLPDDVVPKVKSTCVDQFKKTPSPPGKTSAKQLCSCVAETIGNDLSCDELKRYRADKEFAMATQKRIASTCIEANTSKYP